ncbi:anti-sigma factor family protein [Tropicimonas sp. S265A]|uniref:anti-sigma factor family protein n=1 Tax=Tropicimonas sp. S265A TaxID=3415134 RepID=UPI003C7A605A
MTQYDEKLSAFLDGELSRSEAQDIEDQLARDPQLQADLEALMAADAEAEKAFGEMLDDPVPFDLAAAIHSAPVAGAANEAAAPAPHGWLAIAATVAALAIGGTGGYFAGSSQVPQVAAAPGWLDAVADYHRVYAAQTRHLVEVGADEATHIETWLSNTVGAQVRIPDLTAQGLTFRGARLLVAAGKPVSQLVFTDAQGGVVALCLIQSDTPNEGFANRTIDGFDMVTWGGADGNFVLVGDEGRGDLRAIADVASTQT